jgi:transcriptional regulator GlxA family with amidase domain
MTIHTWVVPVEERSFTPERSRSELVERAEKLALADIDQPIQISAMCRALAVSKRTLRKAFHETHGIPPRRSLRMLRLSGARRALLAADCGRLTVTQVATAFGFLELGRFSVEYRKAFGESPSQTLQHRSGSRNLRATWGGQTAISGPSSSPSIG